MSELAIQGLGLYLALINILVFFLMYYDKRQAVKRRWRISERTLLFLGFIGGGLGGLLGQQLFQHKTRKLYFYICYIAGTILAFGAVFFVRKF